ncbi:hypothetical protein R3P38DRAFT_3233757 [Favolaschia claudopus]|uniref:Uncharacterized protein n=1 Tax=Favolaschia claudopus TaxID=2862362 RepID=A0AAV9ZI06_9AGAR
MPVQRVLGFHRLPVNIRTFANFNWDASQFQAINSNFEDTAQRADTALAAIHSRTPELARAGPFTQTAANLPRRPAPSLHKASAPAAGNVVRGGVKLRAEARRAISVESGSEDEMDEDEADENGVASTKTSFGTGEALIKLASAAVDLTAFLAPHKKKGVAWQAITDTLKKDKLLRRTKINAVTVQRKAEALVAFKKQKETSAGITIAALLEGLEDQYDQAKDKSDAQKEKIKKKADEDRVGGEAIRTASRIAFSKKSKKRARSPSPSAKSDDDAATDTEPAEPVSASSRTSRAAASSSVVIIGSDDEGRTRKPKRPRRADPAAHQAGMLALMEKSEARAAAHDTVIQKSLENFVSDSAKQEQETIDLLKKLVEKD